MKTKILSRYQATLHWLLCAICMILLTSFNADAKSITPDPDPNAYSGEALFRGIFLADGPIAEIIPEVRDLRFRRYVRDREMLQQIEAIHDGIVIMVQQKYPEYMSTLERAVASKNPVQINKQIKAGKQILQSIMQEMGFEPDIQAMHAALKDRMAENGQVSLEDLKEDVINSMKNYSNMLQAKESTEDGMIICLIAMCHVVTYIVVPTDGVEDANNLLDEQMANSLSQL